MDMTKVYQALGIIEGVALCMPENISRKVQKAVGVLSAQICAYNVAEEMQKKQTESGLEGTNIFPVVRVNSIEIEEEDYLNSSQIEELEGRLRKHFTDYINGKTQDFKLVLSDCIQAAVAIHQLKGMLKDKAYSSYMEQP